MNPPRRGFALVVAIALLGVVGAALAALTCAAAADFRRTRGAREDAQLREMLLAGGSSAAQHVQSWGNPPPDETWSLSIPPQTNASQPDGEAAVALSTQREKDVVKIRIDAKLDRRRASQVLTAELVGGKWEITGVTLIP